MCWGLVSSLAGVLRGRLNHQRNAKAATTITVRVFCHGFQSLALITGLSGTDWDSDLSLALRGRSLVFMLESHHVEGLRVCSTSYR